MVTAVAIVSRAIVSRADLAQAEPDDLRGPVRRAGLAGACQMSMRSQRDYNEMSSGGHGEVKAGGNGQAG